MELALPIGYKIGGCQITRLLDRGGFGITYIADHPDYGKVVLKELCPIALLHRQSDFSLTLSRSSDDSEMHWSAAREGFARESEALRGLSTEGIPDYLDRFSANNTLYLVQEYIHGDNLFNLQSSLCLLAQQQPCFLEDLLRRILSSISQVHSAGILHRDIKPANILMRKESFYPVLIDFGGARFQVGGKTYNFDKRVWSPGYSSYEQLDVEGEGQEQNESSDLYSIAATFYFLLFGEDPVDSLDRVSGRQPKQFTELAGTYDKRVLESLDIAFQLFQESRFANAKEWLNYLDQTTHAETQDHSSLGSLIASYWLGRSPDPEKGGTAVAIDDNTETSSVSRNHAVVSEYERGFIIQDISSNGTSIAIDAPHFKKLKSINTQTVIERTDFSLDMAGFVISSNEFISKRDQDSLHPEANVQEHLTESLNSESKCTESHPSPVNEAEVKTGSGINSTGEHYRYASFGRRLGGKVLESFLFSALFILCLFLWSKDTEWLNGFNVGVENSNSILLWWALAVNLLTLILWAFKGKDIGKIMVGAKVLDRKTGQPPTLLRSSIRIIGYSLSALPLGLGFLWMLWDKQHQTWHDKLARTVVVVKADNKKVFECEKE